jgi:lipopolysaccharide export system protein LptA
MTVRIDLFPAFAAIVILAVPLAARAADAPAAKGETPPTRDQGTFEVTADRDLEWLQTDKAYVARGNAVAKKGTVTLMADLIIAYYRPLVAPGQPPKTGQAAKPDTPSKAEAPSTTGSPAKPGTTPQSGFDSGNTEIYRVVAEGHVHVISEDKDGWGDRAEYDKDRSVTILTGQHLKGSTLEDIVFARDSLEYWEDQGMAVARGDALIKKVNGSSLAGDLIGGHFIKDAHGQSVLKTIESQGHVVVTTLTDIVHGDEGVYDIDAKRTVLFGNVRASRGDNTLEGGSAEVNMTTGISQVFPGEGQRVRGLFVHQQSSQDQSQQNSSGTKH